jgi:hypothetical protein
LFQKAVAGCGTRARETPRRENVRAPADLTLAAKGVRPRGAGAVTKTPARRSAIARGRPVVRARESWSDGSRLFRYAVPDRPGREPSFFAHSMPRSNFRARGGEFSRNTCVGYNCTRVRV